MNWVSCGYKNHKTNYLFKRGIRWFPTSLSNFLLPKFRAQVAVIQKPALKHYMMFRNLHSEHCIHRRLKLQLPKTIPNPPISVTTTCNHIPSHFLSQTVAILWYEGCALSKVWCGLKNTKQLDKIWDGFHPPPHIYFSQNPRHKWQSSKNPH